MLLFVFLIFFGQTFFAQTTLVNPNSEGSFESGNSMVSNGWVAINGTTDSWNVGNTITPSAGNNTAFISSNNGSSWAYSQTSSVIHLYKQISIPANEPKISLLFKWKAGGEGLGTDDWDNLKVFFVPDSYVPASGIQIPPTYQIGSIYKLSPTEWNVASISFATVPGSNYKLVFSWKSDILDVVNPPAALDEISVISNPPSNFTSVASGNWTSPSTWDSNSVPTNSDNAIIAATHSVIIDANNLSINDLSISGTLNYGTAATGFEIKGNLLVNSGGNLNAFFGATGKSLTVSRNFTNNGNVDFSKGTALTNILTFNGNSGQIVSGSGTFTNNIIRNLTFNNTSSELVSWGLNNLQVGGNLVFTKGNLSLGNNTLILGSGVASGTGSAAVGALIHTSGGIVSGTFSRWLADTATGATLATGVMPTGTLGKYPFINVSGANRASYVQRVTPSIGGQIACKYADSGNVSTVSVLDGTYNIDSKFDGSWSFSTPQNTPTSASYNIALIGQNTIQSSNGNTRVLRTSTAIEGAHLNGTEFPLAQRTGLTLAQLTQEPLYIGISNADKPNATIASGNWSNPAIWSKNTVPNCNEVASVNSGHSVVVNSATNVCKNLTISFGGTLNVVSGEVTVGCTDNNNSLNILGNLTVSGGVLSVNGNIATEYGSVFSQSGGNINVDGNSGNIATSVPDGKRIVNIVPENQQSLNLTGGTLTIIDPHLASVSNDAIRLSGTFNGGVNVTSGHTLRLGDGISTQAGGNANGFRINTWAVTSGLPLGNLIIEGPSGTNRHVSGTYQIPVYGNLIVNNGGESRIATIYLNGNVTVNNGGTLTSTTGFFFVNARFLDASTVAFNPSLNAQQLTNYGVIRNAVTAQAANFSSLVFTNGTASGVTLNSPISVSTAITLNAGLVHTSNTNLLTIIAGGTSFGGSNSSYIDGPMSRIFASNRTAVGTYTGTTQFPVGKSGVFLPINIDPSTTTQNVEIRGEAFATNSGTFSANIASMSSNRWEASTVSGTMTSANVRITDAAIDANSKMLKATNASGQYAVFSPTSTFGTARLTTNAPIIATDFAGFFSYGQIICATEVDAPTATSPQDFNAGQTISSFVVNGSDIIYYDAQTGGNILPANTPILSGATYYAFQTINGCESPSRVAIVAGNLLSVSDIESIMFKFYPNPVHYELNLVSSEEINLVEIYNLIGQKVLSKKGSDLETKIDVSTLPKATYILKVAIKDLIKTVKIIKQ
jgi:hypothetical protein